MKILYGITKSNFGGAQRYVYDLARKDRDAGHEVSVVVGGNGTLVEKLRAEKIPVITIPYLERDISIVKEYKAFKFIYEVLKKEKPDVFHTNSSKMGGLGNLAARLAGVRKIIFTSHGWAFNESWRPWWQKCLIKFFHYLTILLTNKTICVSEKTRKDVSWPFIKNRLAVIYNGIESFDLKSRVDARHELDPLTPPETLVVGTISELHKVKGLDILLHAWKKFLSRHFGRLILVGDGEEKERLMKLATELGITNSIKFAGFVEDARSLLPAFDIFLLPSRSENLPYSLLEAGFAGLPVLSTKVGGIPEVIENGMSGILVEPNNSEEILSSLILMAESKEIRKRLGENLRETVKEKFTLDQMVRATLNTYE